MYPTGASFRIPEDWLDWNREFHNNLHLSRHELDKVKDGAGEWDTEYGKVVNASLSFDDCSVHVGGDGWGADGGSGGYLQMRGYISDAGRRELEKQIFKSGFTAARVLHKDFDTHPTIEKSTEGEWDKIVITYYLWYEDYGGTGHVEFYLRTAKGHSAVLVFMHAGGQGQAIQQLLHSFSWE